MGNKYLSDLADVCRRTGFPVIEVEGWQNRARGSGGYDGSKPDHVMTHHTASGSSMDGWGDVNYMTFDHNDAPLCNLYLSRDGTIYVCAGGATNTNGSGDCSHISPDTMNSSAIGIEAGNNGVGEQWPDRQQDAYVKLCRTLCDAYKIANDRVHGHAEWAPSRKIDMAGNSRYASGGSTWNFDAFRNDIAGATGPGPTPPPGDDDDMAVPGLFSANNGTAEQRMAVFWWDGKQIGWTRHQPQIDVGRWMGYYQWHGETNSPMTNFSVDELQMMIDNSWIGGLVPPGFRQPLSADSGVT